MTGQGSPQTSRASDSYRARTTVVWWGSGFALLLLALFPPLAAAADEAMRVRIAWGGGAERRWEGVVSLSEKGVLAEPCPLGVEADEPGSMWIEAAQLTVRQRSARAYDGVDLLVTAPKEAKLMIQLTPADDRDTTTAGSPGATTADLPGRSVQFQVPLAELATGFYDQPLDEQGNRLLVSRTPGDSLRIRMEGRDTLIFAPGEQFQCTLEPYLLAATPGSKVQIKTRLVASRGQQESWVANYEVRADQTAAIALDVPLPQVEGVYELIVTATQNGGWQEAVRKPLRPQQWKNKTLAERKVQLVVLGAQGQPDPPLPGDGSNPTELSPVVEIDPANPGWRERLAKLQKLPAAARWFNGPLGNGAMTTWHHPLGEMVRLNPSQESPDVSWEAYTLPIAHPDQPHVLEVDLPSDVSQTIGISILEPNAADVLMPIGLDSGVNVVCESVGGESAPRWLRHRLIFWPRTASPMVLITNRRDRMPAVFGKIRVLAGWEHLPPAAVAGSQPDSQRLLAAYFDRPLFPENFSAREVLDAWSGRSLDDWGTFLDGGTRLVEYLRHVGYNGLMMSVLADGSTIYPSAMLEPTPRYDTGTFFTTAQDPVRKDVLEMLFRLFDNQGLQLIPMLEFASPLPQLETQRRSGSPDSAALEWIDSQGRALRQASPARRGLAPYYNVLHPQVQEAMLEVVREVATRYAHRHSSFRGLAIRLSAEGYAQLPGPEWGMDDATVARFQSDAKVQVPGTGPDRFAQRARFLTIEQPRLWLQWRAAELGRFYRRVQTELDAIQPGSRLYLAGADLLAGEDLQLTLRPALPRKMTMTEALLQVGIDLEEYQAGRQPNGDRIVLLCPERIASTGRLNEQAIDLEIRGMVDQRHYRPDGQPALGFQDLPTPGSLFFHQPQEARIASFDQACAKSARTPFKATYAWLVAQPAPAESQNRRRFVHSLATLDSQAMFDGGWLLPLGQEDAIRDLVAAYRRLPAVRFHDAGDRRGPASSQPVTFRYGSYGGKTYLYVVNDAPFPTTARVHVEAPANCRLEELTGVRQVAPLKRDDAGAYWMVDLQPYDLVAAELSAPEATLSQPRVSLSGAVEAAMTRRIRELGARAAALRSPQPLQTLGNPGFEQPPVAGKSIPDWSATKRPEVAIGPDATQKHEGGQSVKMTTSGPWACLVSKSLDAPSTGRLSVYAWLRVADAAKQPTLQVALAGTHNGMEYYNARLVPVTGLGAAPITEKWNQYEFRFDDLPLEGLAGLQVRFDLMGPGEVWVDDVQLFDMAFGENESKELCKLIMLANSKLEDGQLGDCMRFLDGYWPRFLEEHVAVTPAVVRNPPPRRASSAEEESQRTGLFSGLKGFLPKQLRF